MAGIFATTRPDLWEDRTGEVAAALGAFAPDEHQVWVDRRGPILFVYAHFGKTDPSSASTGAPGADGSFAVSERGLVTDAVEAWGTQTSPSGRRSSVLVGWDARRRGLVAVRDGFGTKPLYHLQHPTGGVTVCTTLAPLTSLGAMAVDPIGLAHYLVFGHSGSQLTLWDRVRKVAPGTLWEWRVGEGLGWSAGSRRLAMDRVTADGTSRRPDLGGALERSVGAQLQGDDVGILTSGGMGSTLVAAVAASSVPRVRTFTLSLEGLGDGGDAGICEANSRLLGTVHRTVRARPPALAEAATAAVAFSGEPLGQPRALPVAVLASALAGDVRIVLTGGGAASVAGSGPSAGGARVLGEGRRRHDPSLRGGDVHALPGPDEWPLSDVVSLARSEWAAARADQPQLEPGHAFDLAMLPPCVTEPTTAVTRGNGVEARLPWLHPAVAEAVGARSAGVARRVLDEELGRRVAGVTRSTKGRSGERLAATVAEDLRDHTRFELESRDSVLWRELGRDVVGRVRARCQSSPITSFRVATLGVWDATFWSKWRS